MKTMLPTAEQQAKQAAATVEPRHEVTAQIDQWRDGKNGRYASAQILSEGAPTQTATCNAIVNHQHPPSGQAFRCIIEKKANGNGYKVTDILIEGLEAELFAIPAVVRNKQGFDLLLDAQPLPEGQSVPVMLPSTLLRQQQIDDIEPGAEVRIDAVRGASGYVASKLHHPTVLDAFNSSESPQTIIAYVKSRWPGKSDSGCYVSFQSPDTAVSASFWVKQSLLKSAGIPATHPYDKAATTEPDSQSLDQWQDLLRQGSPAQVEQLKIDRLELQLEWVEAMHKWQVCRLCRPRALREPQGSEIIDWVEGIVIIDPLAAIGQDDGADPQSAKPAAASLDHVDVAFQDARVGRGTVRLMGKEKIANALLGQGTPVIFSLVAKGEYWNIKCLHRCTPLRPLRAEDVA